MKRIMWLLVMLVIAFMAGCGGGGTPAAKGPSGAVTFQIDLTTLQQNAKVPAKAAGLTAVTPVSDPNATTITAVTATLSRNGYPDIVQEMTVVNNIATATVDNLDQGYWHVSVDAYNAGTLLYNGTVDVKVVAGASVAAEVLFDPAVVTEPTASTGSLSLTVGLNKYPGYTKVRQFVSSILQDKVNQKFYIFDSSVKTIAVYDADTMVREKDIVLPASPQAIAVEMSGGSLLLGYSTGKIYRLNISDETFTYLADSLISINAVVPISTKIALVADANDWGPSNTYETINLETGQVVSSKSYWYPLSNFTYNQSSGMMYGLDSGLSPADIHRLTFSATTGSLDSIGDSRYHGDYYFGAPIRVINNGTRIATGSGNMFISSSSSTDDLTYVGNLGHTFVDLVSDDVLGNIYMLNSDNIKKLLVIKQDTLFTTLSVDLLAEPKQIFNTANSIVVFVKPDSDYYAKVFSKSSLGLI